MTGWTAEEESLPLPQVKEFLWGIAEAECALALRQAQLDAEKAELKHRKVRLLRLQRLIEERSGA